MGNKTITIPKMEKIDNNQSVVIYVGEYDLKLKENKIQVCGLITLKWLPTPNVEFEGKVIDGTKKIKEFMASNEVEIILPNGLKGKVLLTSIDLITINISGVINSELNSEVVDSRVEKLNFALVNFRNNYGMFIEHSNRNYSGRLLFEYGDFEIKIDKRHNYKGIYNDLKKIGGYSITHFAEFKRKDNQIFDSEEVSNIIEALIWLLSFSCGRQVGICYTVGVKNCENVYEQYQAPIIDTWRDIPNWYPIREVYNNLNLIFGELVDKLQDELWGKVLKNIFTWYFDGLRSTYLENKIVSIQIALENIAWTYIVLDKKVMEGNKFEKKINASKKIRLLLKELNIPSEIPEISDLKSISNAYEDGSHLFTAFRNDIVHPKKKVKVDDENWEIKYWVWKLGVKYLELSILRILDYDGKYYNFLKDEKNYHNYLDVVPWSSEDKYKVLITNNK